MKTVLTRDLAEATKLFKIQIPKMRIKLGDCEVQKAIDMRVQAFSVLKAQFEEVQVAIMQKNY